MAVNNTGELSVQKMFVKLLIPYVLLLLNICHFVSGQGATINPPLPSLCGSNYYDIEILKKATYWRAPYPGGCYNSFNDETVPCDFYFSFCKDLPTSLTGTGGKPAGAIQNQTINQPLTLGLRSNIVDDTSGQTLIIGFSGGDEVACGSLGILLIMQCDPNVKWSLLNDGSGVVPIAGQIPNSLEFYNTTSSCAYNMTVRYDGACTKIGPSLPVNESLSAGSILIIIFLATVTVYLLGGVVMNKSAGATGLELIPNLEFWKDLPQLIAEGAVYFWSCPLCQSGGTERTGYESI